MYLIDMIIDRSGQKKHECPRSSSNDLREVESGRHNGGHECVRLSVSVCERERKRELRFFILIAQANKNNKLLTKTLFLTLLRLAKRPKCRTKRGKELDI